MKESFTLIIGSGENETSYPVTQDVDFVTDVNVNLGVSEETKIEYVTISIILQNQIITGDYVLGAIPEMKVVGEDGKIQYINQRIEGKIKSITRVKGEIRQC